MILPKYNFLHVFDDAIICRDTIELFQKLNSHNQHFAIITADQQKWNDVAYKNQLTFIKNDKNSATEISKLIEGFDIIIMQALSFEKAKAIRKNRSNTKVFIWALWGYELYNIVNYFSQNRVELSTTLGSNGILQKIRDYYTFKVIYKKAVEKIDISLFLLEKDFNLLSNCIPNQIIWKEGCYQTINNLISKSLGDRLGGNSILIGNSSTPSNKHSLAIDKISKNNIKNRKVLVPLSYGDTQYRTKVMELGAEKFQDNFHPLTDFFSKESYIEILNSCSHAIFAHERQQAFGSILTMLLLGKKVFLSEKNPLFSWFQAKKIIIYSLSKNIDAELNTPLAIEDQNHNKKQLKIHLDESRILDQLNGVLLDSIDLLKSKGN